jgi:integrase/recombinase XerD
MSHVDAPRVPKRILPSLSTADIDTLLAATTNTRDKAIIVFLTESGLRVSELAGVRFGDIDWPTRTVRVIGKGNKEGQAPFGERTERCLQSWVEECHPGPDKPLFGLVGRGIQHMLSGLAHRTGLPCNPHTFRRTFASLLRKSGVDVLTIKQLGRWESVEMVERYTRSVTFADSMRFYRGPLS